MKARKEIIEANKAKYKKSTKKGKQQILNNICESTGLSRDRAARLLSGTAKSKTSNPKKDSRGKKPVYGVEVIKALEKIWTLMNYSCGKRIKEGIISIVDALERHGEIIFEKEIKEKLFKVSSASIDRLLKPSKDKIGFKGKSTTKPGTLLKKNIPLRLGTEWNDAVPGYVEIDLVAHCGDSLIGEYVNTLDVTDICTGWTETHSVLNKAQKHVFDALMAIEANMPFKYLGIDSDNGSEFINAHLYKYCKDNNICFTRSRPNRKNDGCHVEQKNWAVIRRSVGYDRFEGIKSVEILNAYYALLRLYTNFFLPQTKLISRVRIDSKISKKYEKFKTPYQRVLESEQIPNDIKNQLRELFLTLNPAAIKRQMEKLLEELDKLAIPWNNYHS